MTQKFSIIYKGVEIGLASAEDAAKLVRLLATAGEPAPVVIEGGPKSTPPVIKSTKASRADATWDTETRKQPIKR